MAASALVQLRGRIGELEMLAAEVGDLALRVVDGNEVQPGLATKGQQWYRGCRALMAQHGYSGLAQFDRCYNSSVYWIDINRYLVTTPTLPKESLRERFDLFAALFLEARSLVLAVEAEILSRELPVKTELSYEVAATEFDTAQQMLTEAGGEEVFIRSSGVIARIALERHLFTVADARLSTIIKNPSSKKHADASDVVNTLSKAGVITAVQRSQLESLFAVANNCAHPKGCGDRCRAFDTRGEAACGCYPVIMELVTTA